MISSHIIFECFVSGNSSEMKIENIWCLVEPKLLSGCDNIRAMHTGDPITKVEILLSYRLSESLESHKRQITTIFEILLFEKISVSVLRMDAFLVYVSTIDFWLEKIPYLPIKPLKALDVLHSIF